MHQLPKGERGVSGSQGPTTHPDPHALATATTTRLPARGPHPVSHHRRSSCQITPIHPTTPRAATSPHTPRASLSTAVTSSTQPPTMNYTDKPLPSPPWTRFDISQTYCSVDQAVVLAAKDSPAISQRSAVFWIPGLCRSPFLLLHVRDCQIKLHVEICTLYIRKERSLIWHDLRLFSRTIFAFCHLSGVSTYNPLISTCAT